MINKFFFSFAFLCFAFICKSQIYSIAVDGLKKQFTGVDSTKLTEVKAGVAFSANSYYYKTNPVKRVRCFKGDGEPLDLKITPAYEAHITYGKENKKTSLFFDRMYVRNNNVLVGPENKVYQLKIRAIPFDSITKVEIVWGRLKNTVYR